MVPNVLRQEGDYTFSFLIEASRVPLERPFGGSRLSAPLVNSRTELLA